MYFFLQNIFKLVNEIKLFKLGVELDDYCIVFIKEYQDYVIKVMSEFLISKNICSKCIKLLIKLQVYNEKNVIVL